MDRSQESCIEPNEMVLLCRGLMLHQVQGWSWLHQDYMEVVW
jgi:hypothetical protein